MMVGSSPSASMVIEVLPRAVAGPIFRPAAEQRFRPVFTESITTFQSKSNPLSLVNLEPLPLALVPLFQKTALTFTPLVQVRSSVVLPQRVFNQKNTSSEQENRVSSPKTSYTVNWGNYSAFNLLKDVFRNQFPL